MAECQEYEEFHDVSALQHEALLPRLCGSVQSSLMISGEGPRKIRRPKGKKRRKDEFARSITRQRGRGKVKDDAKKGTPKTSASSCLHGPSRAG